MCIRDSLTPEQYDANVVTKHGSSERVEYAVKFPGDEEGGFVYLPIDAKFPADAYAKLQDAYDAGDSAAIAEAGKHLDLSLIHIFFYFAAAVALPCP